jgi:hypothetical protein
MISGVADIELAEDLPPSTKRLAGILRQDIIDGRLDPFGGELVSQDGIIRKENDEPLTSRDIIMMDWLCGNVIGEIPAIDALTDEARMTVRFSGVESTKK